MNLLVPLDALLAEQNVTRAARRLGVSQPTMSASLRRLRVHFGDELLLRRGSVYVLSPLAHDIQADVRSILTAIEHTFIDRPSFDPATSKRLFRFLLSDYAMTIVAEPLMIELREVAPHTRVSFESVQPASRDDLVDQLLTVDFMLMPSEYPLELPRLEIFRDRWVCISGRERNHPLDDDELAASDWVRVFGTSSDLVRGYEHVSDRVPESGYAVTVDSFMMLPYAVAGSDRLALIQEGMIFQIPGGIGVSTVELVNPVPEIVEMAWWHPSRSLDPGHAWMRGVITKLFGR